MPTLLEDLNTNELNLYSLLAEKIFEGLCKICPLGESDRNHVFREKSIDEGDIIYHLHMNPFDSNCAALWRCGFAQPIRPENLEASGSKAFPPYFERSKKRGPFVPFQALEQEHAPCIEEMIFEFLNQRAHTPNGFSVSFGEIDLADEFDELVGAFQATGFAENSLHKSEASSLFWSEKFLLISYTARFLKPQAAHEKSKMAALVNGVLDRMPQDRKSKLKQELLLAVERFLRTNQFAGEWLPPRGPYDQGPRSNIGDGLQQALQLKLIEELEAGKVLSEND